MANRDSIRNALFPRRQHTTMIDKFLFRFMSVISPPRGRTTKNIREHYMGKKLEISMNHYFFWAFSRPLQAAANSTLFRGKYEEYAWCHLGWLAFSVFRVLPRIQRMQVSDSHPTREKPCASQTRKTQTASLATTCCWTDPETAEALVQYSAITHRTAQAPHLVHCPKSFPKRCTPKKPVLARKNETFKLSKGSQRPVCARRVPLLWFPAYAVDACQLVLQSDHPSLPQEI